MKKRKQQKTNPGCLSPMCEAGYETCSVCAARRSMTTCPHCSARYTACFGALQCPECELPIAGEISLQQLYDALEQFDWFYTQSDDDRIYREGERIRRALQRAAAQLGTAGLKMYTDYAMHMLSQVTGPIKPKPARPA